jgi:hypothetical protein
MDDRASVEELVKAAEFMLAALPEGVHEKFGGYRVGCTCPRCRLVRAVCEVRLKPPPAFPQRLLMNDQQVLAHVAKAVPYNDNEGGQEIERKRVLLAFHLGLVS